MHGLEEIFLLPNMPFVFINPRVGRLEDFLLQIMCDVIIPKRR